MGKLDNENKMILGITIALAALLVGSLAYLFNGGGLTGAQTVDNKQGSSSVNVSEVASIALTADTIDFGTGYVNTNADYAIIDSGINANGNVVNGTWTAITDGTNSEFIVRNDGNVDLNLTLSSTKTAATLLGGTAANAKFQYRPTIATAGNGCLTILYQNGTAANPFGGLNETWTDFTTSTQLVCHNFSYGANKYVEVDLRLQIPKDAPPEVKTDTITFTGTALNGDERV